MGTDSGKSNDHANRNKHWDNPDGLGWQLWLRNRTSSLSGESIQRQVERFQSKGLFRLPSLADEIQRRWQINRRQGFYPFNSDLPLFSARYSLPYNQSPARHFQTYPQQVSKSPAHLLPFRLYSPGFTTAAPQRKPFSGYNILRKKGSTHPAKQENTRRSAVPDIGHPAKYRKEFNTSDETIIFPGDKKKVLGLELLQSVPENISQQDDSPASVISESSLAPEVRQLPDSIPQDEAIPETRAMTKPSGGEPPADMRSTESYYKQAGPKSFVSQDIVKQDIVKHILRRKPAPNLFHSASPAKTQDRSPVYFPGYLKLSDPIYRKTTPLIFRSPLQGKTNYETDRSAQTVSNLTSQPENELVEVSAIRADTRRPAVHDVLSLNRSGGLTSQPLNESIAASRQTAHSPSSGKQPLTEKELTVARQVPNTIATRLSPSLNSEQNRKDTYPGGQWNNDILGISKNSADPIKTAVNTVHSAHWPGRHTGFSTPLTSLLFNKQVSPARQTGYYSTSGKQPLTEKELTVARKLPNTTSTGLSTGPYSEVNSKSMYSGGQSKNDIVGISKNGADPIKTAVHSVLSRNRSGRHSGFSAPATSMHFNKSMATARQTADNPLSQKHSLAGKKLSATRQVSATIAPLLSPARYSEQNMKSTYPKDGTVQRLSDPGKKNTPDLQAISPQPSSASSSLTLQPAGRVTANIMRRGNSLHRPYYNKSITNLPGYVNKTQKEQPRPTVLSSPLMSHSLKSEVYSQHNRGTFSSFPKMITRPANRQNTMSFTNQQLFAKYTRLPLFENTGPNKANALALSPTLSPNILGRLEQSMNYSDFPGKRVPNNIANIFIPSHRPYSTLQRATTVKSDKISEQLIRVKNDDKELTHPVKSQRVIRHLSMSSPVQPSNRWPLFAKIPNFSNNSPKQYKNISSQGVSPSLQLTSSQIQRKSTESRTSDGFNIPHNSMVPKSSVANSTPPDLYSKIQRPPSLNAVEKHALLHEAGTIPTNLATQSGPPDLPHIVEGHKNGLFYPESQKPFVRHLANNATSNLAASRLFLKWSAPSAAGQAPPQQMIEVHSKEAPSTKRSFIGQDMPLALMPSNQGRAQEISNTAGDSQLVQTSPLELAEGTSAAGAVSAPPADTGLESSMSNRATGQPQAAMDLDELVEKTWLKIMRKLTIERERRGHNKWI
ncbi:MAG: hypothetical protein GY799_21635 [Desulfobulbaceae bacterium]|nr:hypothetical protein [Desulfobulbaceae bacterium]